MKFKTLRRLLSFLVVLSVVNSVVATMVVVYAYGAMLDFVEPPFAMLFSGVLATLGTAIISTVIGDIIIKAYKAFLKEKNDKR
jgi:uncharacterized membrane protein